MDIGKKLKQARVRKGLTQKELADLVGSTPAAISDYELDKRTPRVELLIKLGMAVGVGINDLLETLDRGEEGVNRINELVKAFYDVSDTEREEFFERIRSVTKGKVVEAKDGFEAGPLPRGFDEELWSEVPRKIGAATARALSAFLGVGCPEGDELIEEDVQTVFKVLFYYQLRLSGRGEGKVVPVRTEKEGG